MTTDRDFTEIRAGHRPLGHARRDGDRLFFFGRGDADAAALRARFPNFDFARVHQVHGDAVVEATLIGSDVRADAHVTAQSDLAPVVVTADCIPVLLASRTRVAAVHAGWRGVAARIIAKAIGTFPDQVESAAIGPHLARASFEIGRDVAAGLNAARPDSVISFEHPHPDPSKVFYDLTALARAQILAAAGAGVRIAEFTPDTKTSLDYHSYRRDGPRSGRNLSFVVRIGQDFGGIE